MKLLGNIKMIRPEAHQWNWKPKTRSKDDMKLDKDLEILRKKLGLRKNELYDEMSIDYGIYLH